MYERSLKGLLDYGIQSDECKDEKEIYECVKSLYETFINIHDIEPVKIVAENELVGNVQEGMYNTTRDINIFLLDFLILYLLNDERNSVGYIAYANADIRIKGDTSFLELYRMDDLYKGNAEALGMCHRLLDILYKENKGFSSRYREYRVTHDYMCLNDEDLISGFESILYSDEKDYEVIEIQKSKNQDIHWFKFDDNVIEVRTNTVIKCDFYSVLVSRNKKVFRLFPLYLDLSLESKNQPVTLHETTEAKIRRKALLSN